MTRNYCLSFSSSVQGHLVLFMRLCLFGEECSEGKCQQKRYGDEDEDEDEDDLDCQDLEQKQID